MRSIYVGIYCVYIAGQTRTREKFIRLCLVCDSFYLISNFPILLLPPSISHNLHINTHHGTPSSINVYIYTNICTRAYSESIHPTERWWWDVVLLVVVVFLSFLLSQIYTLYTCIIHVYNARKAFLWICDSKYDIHNVYI